MSHSGILIAMDTNSIQKTNHIHSLIEWFKAHDSYHIIFVALMWWRIIYGFMRIGIGILLIHLVGSSTLDVVTKLARKELLEDPNDAVLAFITLVSHHAAIITFFVPMYLMFWGTVDIFLSANILREKLWAFPISIYLSIIFVLYEIVRFTHTHSTMLIVLICVDIVFIVLIWREYQKLSRKKSSEKANMDPIPIHTE